MAARIVTIVSVGLTKEIVTQDGAAAPSQTPK